MLWEVEAKVATWILNDNGSTESHLAGRGRIDPGSIEIGRRSRNPEFIAKILAWFDLDLTD